MDFVLGVDGGNSKTVALVSNLEGCLLGAGRSGPSDIYVGDPEDSFAEVECAIGEAMDEAGIERGQLVHGAFAMAGADWPEDFALLERTFRERGYGRDVTIVNDAMGALRAGSPSGLGVVLAAGTGMAIGAKAPCGRFWHSSNWPTAGGGARLGQAALDAVFRAELGVGPATTLTALVVEAFDVETAEQVLHRLTARGNPRQWREHSSLAPLVLDEADAGDPVARGIVTAFGNDLGAYAVAAAKRVGLGPEPFPIVLTGGVFRHPSRIYLESLMKPLEWAFPGSEPIRSRFEPVAGAVMLALERAGVSIAPAILDEMAGSMPPMVVFETRRTGRPC